MLNFDGSSLNTTPLGSRGLGSTGPTAGGGLPAIAYGQAAQRVPYSYPISGHRAGPFSSALRDQVVENNPGIPEGWTSDAYETYNSLSSVPITADSTYKPTNEYYYGYLNNLRGNQDLGIDGATTKKVGNRDFDNPYLKDRDGTDAYYLSIPVANAPANIEDYYHAGNFELRGTPTGYNRGGMVRGYADGGLASAVSPEMFPPGQPEIQSDPQDEQFITLALEAIDPASGMPDEQRQIILEEFEKRYGEGAVEELMRQFEEAQEVPIDDIPAMLTEGEVVIPRDAVKGADPNGTGSVEAGARELMSMVDELRNVRGGEAAMPPAAQQGIAAALGGR